MVRSLVAGVDEAGRGSVLGPLVIALIAVEEETVEELSAMGVRDSKSLTPRARERLFGALVERGAVIRVKLLEPESIDRSARSRGGIGLNALELRAIRELIEEVKPRVVYVDSPYRTPTRARELMGRVEGVDVRFAVRADVRFPVVAAASIVAKVTRDRAVRGLGDVGSGYPSDPRTMGHLRALAASGSLPDYVRRSWRTVRSLGTPDRHLDEG
ncbi:MAG: ribonuclease HII [Nitrososphaeria archaeon]|nr:ribonuclease HII [Nitrososphaeria archaeon]